MARVVVTMKVMPESPETDLDKVKDGAELLIKQFGGDLGKFEVQPVAFGLQQLILMFVMEESIGSTETLEADIAKVRGVQSVEVTDVRRTIG